MKSKQSKEPSQKSMEKKPASKDETESKQQEPGPESLPAQHPKKRARTTDADPEPVETASKKPKRGKKSGEAEGEVEKKVEKKAESKPRSSTLGGGQATINRAPVLTLWVSVVAELEGYDRDTALSFGRWIAGHFAQAKGKALGIYETPSTEEAAERREQRAASREQHHVQKYPAFGTQIYGIETDEGVRACDSNGKPLSAAVAVSYVEKAFGDKLEDARTAMRALAESIPRDELGKKAYHLYEKFRPASGWGQKAALKFDSIRGLIE